MPDILTVKVEGDEAAERRLQQIALLLSDLRSFWPLATRLAIGWIGRQFDDEGGFYGGGWEPLSDDYAAWKAAHYPGKRILQRTGALRRAATSPTRHVTPTSLTLTIEEYDVEGRTVQPSWFQDGTSRMPARPLIFEDLPASAAAEFDAAAERYVAGLLRAF